MEVFTLPGQDEHIEFRVPVELLDVPSAQQISKGKCILGIPLLQKMSVGSYVVRQRLTGRKRYPLVLMLEPLFRCNLACAGCGKIDYPDEILNQRMSVADALDAVDECGAPVVSIAGGEPLLHKELPEIVRGIIARKKFVYLCTNALLMDKKHGRVRAEHLSSSGRCISTATRRCTTTRCARTAPTTAP